MSRYPGAVARRHPRADVRRFGPLVTIIPLIGLLAVGVASADRSGSVLRMSAADARRSGQLVVLVRRAVGGSRLIDVQVQGSEVLLALSGDGAQAALADSVGQPSGTLSLARADGSQLRIALPGLLAAGFSVDGSWIAVLDGRGALWRVDAASGDATQVAAGPFLGSPIVAADGSLMALSVSSVEAPYRSQLVRVAQTGAVTPLTGDDLDYAAYPLVDGGVAVVSHEGGGTIVRSVGAGASTLIAALEPGAVDTAVAAGGDRIAYQLAGRILLLDRRGASPRPLGPGSHPCFAADGSSLLVRRPAETAALALDGSVIATARGQAGLVGAVGCLP